MATMTMDASSRRDATTSVRGTGREERRLSMAGKLALGALGGMTPLLASLALADVEVVAAFIEQAIDEGGEPYHLIGYIVRVVGLTGLGALWVYLHRSEYEPLKVFQLGIVAPAMIAGFINASNVSEVRNPGATAFICA